MGLMRRVGSFFRRREGPARKLTGAEARRLAEVDSLILEKEGELERILRDAGREPPTEHAARDPRIPEFRKLLSHRMHVVAEELKKLNEERVRLRGE